MTSRELATLATHIIADYPDLYPMFATKRFQFKEYKSDWCQDWGRTHTMNYNKLLFIMPGADGLKTGHTSEGGYGMVASAKIGGRRLVGVINGFNGQNHDALAKEMKKLLEYGYAETMNKVFFSPGDVIVNVPVWYGRQDTVPATVQKPFVITVPKENGMTGVRVVARYNEPQPAPIAQGAEVGEIIAQKDGQVIARAPLVAVNQVKKVQFFGRIIKNIRVILGID